MLNQLTSRIQHISSRIRELTPTQTVARVASMLAVAGLVFAAMPQSSEAHASHAYALDFYAIKCLDESNEASSHDEPYVLFFVGNLGSSPVATGVAKRTNVFTGVDDGETKYQNVRLWGTGGGYAAMPGNNPDNLIVLVQIMEHDGNSDPNAIRAAMQSIMGANIAQYKLQGWSRSTIVSHLKSDMAGIINTFDFPVQNDDDRVGNIMELRVDAGDIAYVHAGNTGYYTLQQNDGGDGSYRTYFKLLRA
jgi:hypothetical protein